jgi:hypothetical protein
MLGTLAALNPNESERSSDLLVTYAHGALLKINRPNAHALELVDRVLIIASNTRKRKFSKRTRCTKVY